MQGLELNKGVAAVLVALILGKVSDLLSRTLVDPQPIGTQAYQVEGLPASRNVTKQEPQTLEPVGPLLATASVEQGKVVAKKCLQCHTFERGGPNRVGPNLWGVVGEKHARLDGFAYSTALKKIEGPWDYEALNAYLYQPRTYAPGNKMAFVGLQKAQDRANIILYLRSLSDQPVPLPETVPQTLER